MASRLPAFVIVGAALALGAAQPIGLLGKVQPGLWEIDGMPEASEPVKQCITDVAALARYEHRAKTCTAKTIRDNGTISAVEYSCGASEFGHSEVELLTPRSLKISTQGISGGMPFNYVLQAHRLGDCPAGGAMKHH